MDNAGETRTGTFCLEIARKLKGHLANCDQVEQALQCDPDNEELQKLKTDLLEIIRLESKELLGSERHADDGDARNSTSGITKRGSSSGGVSKLETDKDLQDTPHWRPPPNNEGRQIDDSIYSDFNESTRRVFKDLCKVCWSINSGHITANCPHQGKKAGWSHEVREMVRRNRITFKDNNKEHYELRRRVIQANRIKRQEREGAWSREITKRTSAGVYKVKTTEDLEFRRPSLPQQEEHDVDSRTPARKIARHGGSSSSASAYRLEIEDLDDNAQWRSPPDNEGQRAMRGSDDDEDEDAINFREMTRQVFRGCCYVCWNFYSGHTPRTCPYKGKKARWSLEVQEMVKKNKEAHREKYKEYYELKEQQKKANRIKRKAKKAAVGAGSWRQGGK